MQKREFVYREILFQSLEKKNNEFTQSALASLLNISLSNVNHALKPLKRMNAIKVNPRNFVVVNPKKILMYWCSIRNLAADILFQGHSKLAAENIEKTMPDSIIFGAYSAFKFRFNYVPADYSSVYVYAPQPEEITQRIKLTEKNPNVFILKKDSFMERYGKLTTFAQTFVDLWNLSEWYAKDFLTEMEARLDAILE